MIPTSMNPYPNNPAKAREAMHEMAMQGDLPGCAPVGYKNVTENYRKKVAINEDKARLVRLAFGMAATDDKPLRSILKELTAYGLTSRNGKPMGVSSFWGMLTNPFYAGRLRYKGKAVQGLHEPLVDMRLFDAVQRRLEGRNRSHRQGRTGSSAPSSETASHSEP